MLEQAPSLYAYETEEPVDMPITPAAVGRTWMDATDDRFAYRCLPLVIANQCGWWIANPRTFSARWAGGDDPADLRIDFQDGDPSPRVASHFGSGIITFRLPYLFRTPPGINLWVKGPANWIKDGVQALEGIVETDWATATFTMNWKVTRVGHEVRFEQGDPICMIVPLPRAQVENLRPRLAPLKANQELDHEYQTWKASRMEFLKVRPHSGSKSWQKHYKQGRTVTGQEFSGHQIKLDVKPFTRDS